MTSADLLLHPVRLRIVQAFLGDRALTTTGLRAELPDVPAASLYRHVARLVDGGVLGVVAERRVRGAVERTYVLRTAAASIGLDELAKMTPDEHRQAFLAYVAGLIGDFDRYLARGDIDLLRDGVSYRMAAVWLDDAEAMEFIREIVTVVRGPSCCRVPIIPTPPDLPLVRSRPSLILDGSRSRSAGSRPGRKTVEIVILADPQRLSRVDLTFRQLTAARRAGTLEQLEVTPLRPTGFLGKS